MKSIFTRKSSKYLKRPKHSVEVNFENTNKDILPKVIEKKSFPQFNNLSDDIQLVILSYVADAPFNFTGYRLDDDGFYSSLTHILPLVSLRFRSMVRSRQADCYVWKNILLRRIRDEPLLWKEGARQLIKDMKLSSAVNETSNDEIFLDEVYNAYSGNVESSDNIYQAIYRYIVSNYIRYTGPVFYMPGQVRLHHVIGLHFFEPRYRLLIKEVMENSPMEHKCGESITKPYPTFIYANQSPLAKYIPAVIVEVHNCMIHSDGRADVILNCKSYVWIEQVWCRPQDGNLYMARVIRMNRKCSMKLDGI